jgi:hypothetical protein
VVRNGRSDGTFLAIPAVRARQVLDGQAYVGLSAMRALGSAIGVWTLTAALVVGLAISAARRGEEMKDWWVITAEILGLTWFVGVLAILRCRVGRGRDLSRAA